jgi:hypothetical protein
VCRKLSEVISNQSDSTQRFVVKGELGEGLVFVPPYTTGWFEDTNIPLTLKTACFYIDWDEERKKPKFIIPMVDKDQLTYNIRRAVEVVNRFDFL